MSDNRLSIREAARQRQTLGGPDAQALEGALQQVERLVGVIEHELDAIKSDVRELLEALPERAWTERVTGALQRLKARVS